MSYYWGNRYQVIGTDCCLATTERMRLGAGGSFGIGNNTPTIPERYCFQTAEVAQIFAGILNRDLERSTKLVFATSHDFGIRTSVFEMRSAGREIFRMSQDGEIIKLDMPYLVWTWIKLSAGARFLRTLWYGSRAE